MQITTRNARFQQWQSLLDNRTKRTRAGQFLVQGVRPITLAARHDWPIRTLIHPIGRPLSQWATGLLDELRVERIAMAPELLAELTGKDEPAELVAVVTQAPDKLDRIAVRPDFLGVVFDRPTSPGNVGTVIRSADAFGAAGVIVAGHAADPYDPKAVRASTGSLFALPVVRVPAPSMVIDWLADVRAAGVSVRLVGTDETGRYDVADHDLTGPTLLVVGNETSGMSAAWREACDVVVRIPIGGAASSLNAASAASVVLYEVARQRA
ncbi:MAG TPA: TrmH family RNA methyltransferase [Pseudonocardiaceae bacterium]|jgi:TrmH family RNA methyltransferase|nr:TrmH family RNA methyltransferase [Pseudonocardiaceae bacterium]